MGFPEKATKFMKATNVGTTRRLSSRQSYSRSESTPWTLTGGRGKLDNTSFEHLHTEMRTAQEILVRLGMQREGRVESIASRLADVSVASWLADGSR